MERTITPDALKARLADRANLLLLDVRRRTDLDADTDALPNAEWRDPDNVEEWSRTLPKDKPVVLYCSRGGSVSNRVLDRLLEQDFPAQYLEGGIAAWRSAGNKTVPKPSPGK